MPQIKWSLMVCFCPDPSTPFSFDTSDVSPLQSKWLKHSHSLAPGIAYFGRRQGTATYPQKPQARRNRRPWTTKLSLSTNFLNFCHSRRWPIFEIWHSWMKPQHGPNMIHPPQKPRFNSFLAVLPCRKPIQVAHKACFWQCYRMNKEKRKKKEKMHPYSLKPSTTFCYSHLTLFSCRLLVFFVFFAPEFKNYPSTGSS